MKGFVILLCLLLAVGAMGLHPSDQQIESAAMAFQRFLGIEESVMKVAYSKQMSRFMLIHRRPEGLRQSSIFHGGTIISSQDVANSPVSQRLIQSKAMNYPLEFLVVYLMFEKSDPASELRPLFDVLDLYPKQLPLLTAEQEWHDVLGATYGLASGVAEQFHERVQTEKSKVQDHYNFLNEKVFRRDSILFPPSHFRLEDYEYAYAIMQRLLWATEQDTILAPILAVMHFSAADSCYKGVIPVREDGLSILELHSGSATREQSPKWEEMRICPSGLSNGDLLLTRAELVSNNPLDCVSVSFRVVNAVWQLARLHLWDEEGISSNVQDMNEGMEHLGDSSFCLSESSLHNDPNILGLARLLSLSGSLVEFKHVGNAFHNQSISIVNEFHAHRLLLEALKSEVTFQKFGSSNHRPSASENVGRSGSGVAVLGRLLTLYALEQNGIADRVGERIVSLWNSMLYGGFGKGKS